MKVVICGDTHIGAVFGLGGPNGKGGNTRVDDYEKTLNYIVDYCINNKIEVFIQTGDAFDKRHPTSEHIEVFNNVLRRLSLNGIFSIVIMGNHDYKRAGTHFTSSITSLPAKDYPNVRLVLNPEIISYTVGAEKANFLLMPFRDRKMYGNKTAKEDSIEYEAEVAGLIKSVTGPIVAVGHNFFYEGSYHDYGGAEILAKVEAFKDCDLVAMGHYHNFKILKKNNPIAIYTGSMEKINFGDIDSKKAFVEYDISNKSVKINKAPSRELWDGDIDLSDASYDDALTILDSQISKQELKEKIVRLKIVIPENLSATIKRNTVEKQLYDSGAYYVSKVNLELIYHRLIRDTSILEEETPFEMFKAFVKDQLYDDETEKKILIEARSIMEK